MFFSRFLFAVAVNNTHTIVDTLKDQKEKLHIRFICFICLIAFIFSKQNICVTSSDCLSFLNMSYSDHLVYSLSYSYFPFFFRLVRGRSAGNVPHGEPKALLNGNEKVGMKETAQDDPQVHELFFGPLLRHRHVQKAKGTCFRCIRTRLC